MMTTVTHPTCEYRTNPLGIDVTSPRFSWRLESERRGARQRAYQILVASQESLLEGNQADLWDSGKLESDRSVLVPYGGKSLTSRQRAYWRVSVWDEQGDLNTSQTAWFEMGLLKRADWQASWVSPWLQGGARSSVPVPQLRKGFHVPGEVASARLYASAVGVYRCSLNGEPVGEDVLTPGWTDYNTRVQYQVYDVTSLLHEGDNALGTLLGDGWAVGFVGLGQRQHYADKPKFLAQLELTLTGGQHLVVTTDESWKHSYGPILESDMFMGEAYDARLELPGWDMPGFDDGDWLELQRVTHEAALVATNGPTVKRMQELAPISEPEVKHQLIRQRAIFDLGQNMVGWVRLKGSAPAGTTLVLRFAEVLNPDGSLYTTNLREARATDVYTFKGEGEEVWEPHFTFHGFRYVEVSGYPAEITRDMITGVVLHSDMPQTGHFECSDETINQLQQNIVWGQKGNFLEVPTDCPQRDERLGWTGDIQVFARTAAFNMNIASFMTKWLQDVADAQSERGAIPPVVPSVMKGFDDGGPAWADAVVICPWTLYLCYGDRRILAEHYPVMTRFMDFLLETSPGYIRCAPDYDGWHGFGDWLSINADTPRDLIGTAFFAYDAKLMAQIASVLGKRDDAQSYETLSHEVNAAFAKRYLKGGEKDASSVGANDRQTSRHADAISRGNLQAVDYGPVSSEVFNTDLFTPSQTAYVLALQFGLLPENLRPLAANELVADIERRDMHLSTGFVGAPYLPHVLSDHGKLDTAYALLQQTSWPSWLYPVTQGATTIWERWDGWTEERGFQDPSMNSFNHYAYGSIGAWLYQVVAGLELDPETPGYKHIRIEPRPGGGLSHAKASLLTLYGQAKSAWCLEGGALQLEVTIPPNTTATVTLPGSSLDTISEGGKALEASVGISGVTQEGGSVRLELSSGRYTFTCPQRADT